jgi:hypothetical protein
MHLGRPVMAATLEVCAAGHRSRQWQGSKQNQNAGAHKGVHCSRLATEVVRVTRSSRLSSG